MRFTIAVVAALLSAPAYATSPPPDPCGNGVTCPLGPRSYQAKTPPGWDGESALPVLIHFHGWGRTGTNVIRNARIAGATDAVGMLLLAPDGMGKSWSFRSDRTGDIALTEAMLADAQVRWPIDRARIYVSGFSYGSAMAWRLACDQGDRYAGFLGIAGTLSDIGRRDCPTGPFTLRQIHGEKDTVMRAPWANDWAAWQAALDLSGCSDDGVISKAGRYQRSLWSDCADGHAMQVDVHTGGHWIPKDWLRAQLAEFLGRARD